VLALKIRRLGKARSANGKGAKGGGGKGEAHGAGSSDGG
jgi:hypothetical protein